MIFYQTSLWIITSRLNYSTFWVFEPVFTIYIWYVWSKSSFPNGSHSPWLPLGINSSFPPILLFRPMRLLRGPQKLSKHSKLALIERNMHDKIFLKLVLKSWDYDIFGITTSFYEMHMLRPLLDAMVSIFPPILFSAMYVY